ncbi:16439_t:CDS:2 [Racocetra fulgida]|uniref:16439_t:CDS:1 n=1 Tax=Racocetra fulgida TaxID=60492 RepID=A0A9N8VXT3_9GLOM|nr:16439_t:CDS:2 [Racocetra fulgida]
MVPIQSGSGPGGCIYEFWTSAMIERHANLEEAKVITKVCELQVMESRTAIDVMDKRIYNINTDQKPSNSRRSDKNDAVLYQDNNATIYMNRDIMKLARNGVDDLNYHFLQYEKSSITIAKKIQIHQHPWL